MRAIQASDSQNQLQRRSTARHFGFRREQVSVVVWFILCLYVSLLDWDDLVVVVASNEHNYCYESPRQHGEYVHL